MEKMPIPLRRRLHPWCTIRAQQAVIDALRARILARKDDYRNGLRQGHYDAIAMDIGCPGCGNRLRIPDSQHRPDCELESVAG